MFGSIILETVIGVIFIYLLISLFCTALNEGISNILKIRANTLYKWIGNFLGDGLKDNQKLIDIFYKNALIKNLQNKSSLIDSILGYILKNPDRNKPAYIPANVFSLVVLDKVLKVYDTNPNLLNASKYGLIDMINAEPKNPAEKLPDNLKQALLMLAKTADNKIENMKTNLEKYFDDAMERVTGWYKRSTNVIILFLSIAICASFNVDTIGIVNKLDKDTSMRQALSSYAILTTNSEMTNANSSIQKTLNDINDTVTNTQIPIGWNNISKEIPNNSPIWLYIEKALGILISALAVSLGSPFWFNMLEDVIKLTGVEPKKTSATP